MKKDAVWNNERSQIPAEDQPFHGVCGAGRAGRNGTCEKYRQMQRIAHKGAKVFLEEADKEGRKTKYSLITVYKGNVLVNMDSQAPNQMAAEALAEGKIAEIGSVDFLKREVKYGNSRFDLYYQQGEKKGFIEVKGITLEEDGIAMFPDAPTKRGTKHLRELIRAKEEGYESAVLFVIQMKGITEFRPNEERDRKFTEALRDAAAAGVKILAYDCGVEIGKVWMEERVPVHLV